MIERLSIRPFLSKQAIKLAFYFIASLKATIISRHGFRSKNHATLLYFPHLFQNPGYAPDYYYNNRCVVKLFIALVFIYIDIEVILKDIAIFNH